MRERENEGKNGREKKPQREERKKRDRTAPIKVLQAGRYSLLFLFVNVKKQNKIQPKKKIIH